MENELGFMIRGDNLKYTLYDNGDEMLIDLAKDPGEMINLAEVLVYLDRKEKLKRQLKAHIEKASH
jgi:choline-sulfatase